MVIRAEDINDKKKSARSKADFIRLAGIGPELAEFLTKFVEKPDHFYSIPFQRRREIEKQMDAVFYCLSDSTYQRAPIEPDTRWGVYVTTGLPAEGPRHQLRGVLAHEVAHADLGHVEKAQTIGAVMNIGIFIFDQVISGLGYITPLQPTWE